MCSASGSCCPIIGGGFGWRALARELAGFVPVAGIAIKGAIAYAGTIVVGEGVTFFLEHGKHMTKGQAAQLYERAKGRRASLCPRVRREVFAAAKGSSAFFTVARAATRRPTLQIRRHAGAHRCGQLRRDRAAAPSRQVYRGAREIGDQRALLAGEIARRCVDRLSRTPNPG